TRPRNVRRESSVRRSSCARNSDAKGAGRVAGIALSLVERLEVVSDLVVIVARHLLARDRVLHHLAVLPDHPEVHEARRHRACAAGEVRVIAILPAAARLALDTDVVRVAAHPRRRIALRHGAPALAGQEPLALAEVLVLRPDALAPPGALTPARAALILAAAAQALPRALRLLQQPEPLVALLQKAVEVGPLVRQRGVLEDRREVTRGRPAARTGALREVALLERRPLEGVPRQRPRPLRRHFGGGPVLVLLLL